MWETVEKVVCWVFREQPCFDVQKVEEIKRKLLLVLPLLPLLLLSSFFFIFVCVF